MLIADRGLARRDQGVLSDHLSRGSHDHHKPPVVGAQLHLRADQPGRDGVTRRRETDAGQPVDLAGGHLADAGPQRRQRAEQFPFGQHPLRRDRADLAVHDAVDLGAPGPGRVVRRGQVTERRLSHHQVGLGIADQVLHYSLALRIGCPAKIGLERVMRGEPHVLRGGHHDVGDHAALQAAHPVREHLARHPAQDLEALRQHRQRRLRLLISGEPHEPDPRPRQHRAEHVQPALGAPVDHQVLTRRPHRRAAAAVMILPPRLLLRRDQPAEVPRRAGITRGLSRRQQPLGRDPARGGLHPRGDQLRNVVIVMTPLRTGRRAAGGLMPGDHPPHRLMRRTSDLRGPAESAHLTVGGDDVHAFPRRLQ